MVYGHAQQSDDYKENLGLYTGFLGCSKMSRSTAWQLGHGDEGNEKMSEMRLTAAICLFRYLFEKMMKPEDYLGNVCGTRYLQ
jgi:hypothetical protein